MTTATTFIAAYALRPIDGEWAIVDTANDITVGAYENRADAVLVATKIGLKERNARFLDGDVRARVQVHRAEH